MTNDTQPSELAERTAQLIGRSALCVLPIIGVAAYRLYTSGAKPTGEFPHSLVLIGGGILSLIAILGYVHLISSPTKPSWANAMTAFGGFIPYCYALYVIGFIGIWPLVQTFTDPQHGSVLLGLVGIGLGHGLLSAFWQITELGEQRNQTDEDRRTAEPSEKFNKQNFNEILDKYGELIERVRPTTAIHDESLLSHPKGDIRAAICLALMSPNNSEEARGGLIMCLRALAQFQPGVGPTPLWPNGINMERVMSLDLKAVDLPDRFLQSVDSDLQARFEKFRPMVDAEREILIKLGMSIRPMQG